MSTKPIRRISRTFLVALSVIAAAGSISSRASAQQSDVEIRLLPDSASVAIEISGAPERSWS
ncbi:MAG TPA: hypothetical protein VHP99_05045, partial [Pyrinomonadaceae bacterium]|nr:hypothetical protein [Pyrinomonadaceae bacterium]